MPGAGNGIVQPLGPLGCQNFQAAEYLQNVIHAAFLYKFGHAVHGSFGIEDHGFFPIQFPLGLVAIEQESRQSVGYIPTGIR